jgi:hypothetical protein
VSPPPGTDWASAIPSPLSRCGDVRGGVSRGRAKWRGKMDYMCWPSD